MHRRLKYQLKSVLVVDTPPANPRRRLACQLCAPRIRVTRVAVASSRASDELPEGASGGPAAILLVLDCSLPAEEFDSLVTTVTQMVDALPPDTPVGLITYAEVRPVPESNTSGMGISSQHVIYVGALRCVVLHSWLSSSMSWGMRRM